MPGSGNQRGSGRDTTGVCPVYNAPSLHENVNALLPAEKTAYVVPMRWCRTTLLRISVLASGCSTHGKKTAKTHQPEWLGNVSHFLGNTLTTGSDWPPARSSGNAELNWNTQHTGLLA